MRDILDPSKIKQCLKTDIIGKKIYLFDEIDSTNMKALKLGEAGDREGTLILTESQTKGKGRLGRTWYSPKGVNLYLSVILRPIIPLKEAPLTTFVAAISIAETIMKVTDIKPGIKWPNDIMINGKKIAGTLTELVSDGDKVNYIVLGMGINLNMDLSSATEEIRNRAGSLREASGNYIDRTYFLVFLLSEFEYYYLLFKKGERRRIMDIYTSYSVTLGKRIRVDSRGLSTEGLVEGFSRDGALLIKKDDGAIETILSGDIELAGGKR